VRLKEPQQQEENKMDKFQYETARLWLDKNNLEFERDSLCLGNGFKIYTEQDGHGNHKLVYMKTFNHFKSFKERYENNPIHARAKKHLKEPQPKV
jgi:hypothetical protein